MPNTDGLKPFKKGAPNPGRGRKKGSQNKSTIVKKWLGAKSAITNPITGKMEKLTQEDIITLAMINQARNGSVRAYVALMDAAYGKSPIILHKTDDHDLPVDGAEEFMFAPFTVMNPKGETQIFDIGGADPEAN